MTAAEIAREVDRRLNEHVQLIAMVLRMSTGYRALAALNGDLKDEARATCEALANEADALLLKVRAPE